jgi:hypothetical protein
MKVRLKKPWGQWSVGHVFTEMPGGQARTLIGRGIAEEIKDEEPKKGKRYLNRMMQSTLLSRDAR